MYLHESLFGYLEPTGDQKETMQACREAAREYADVIERNVPDGADKTYAIRKLREIAMWVNVAITREADGTPRR